jgi:hypothetical protein
MKKEEVAGLFVLAGIKVKKMWEIRNKYWPNHPDYAKIVTDNPWWLVQTEAGMVEIGNRKRVISIDWCDIEKIRKVITADDVTKNELMVHAWNNEKALEYLTALGKEISALTVSQ